MQSPEASPLTRSPRHSDNVPVGQLLNKRSRAPAAPTPAFSGGDRVEAKYETNDGMAWFRGVVEVVNGSKVTIRFSDSGAADEFDAESPCLRRVEPMLGFDVKSNGRRFNNKPVEVYWSGDKAWYGARVIRVLNTGEIQVTYDDGDNSMCTFVQASLFEVTDMGPDPENAPLLWRFKRGKKRKKSTKTPSAPASSVSDSDEDDPIIGKSNGHGASAQRRQNQSKRASSDRYAFQRSRLKDMGFSGEKADIALERAGGRVGRALEYLFEVSATQTNDVKTASSPEADRRPIAKESTAPLKATGDISCPACLGKHCAHTCSRRRTATPKTRPSSKPTVTRDPKSMTKSDYNGEKVGPKSTVKGSSTSKDVTKHTKDVMPPLEPPVGGSPGSSTDSATSQEIDSNGAAKAHAHAKPSPPAPDLDQGAISPGMRVEVWYSNERQWFAGTVVKVNDKDRSVTMKYDDGAMVTETYHSVGYRDLNNCTEFRLEKSKGKKRNRAAAVTATDDDEEDKPITSLKRPRIAKRKTTSRSPRPAAVSSSDENKAITTLRRKRPRSIIPKRKAATARQPDMTVSSADKDVKKQRPRLMAPKQSPVRLHRQRSLERRKHHAPFDARPSSSRPAQRPLRPDIRQPRPSLSSTSRRSSPRTSPRASPSRAESTTRAVSSPKDPPPFVVWVACPQEVGTRVRSQMGGIQGDTRLRYKRDDREEMGGIRVSGSEIRPFLSTVARLRNMIDATEKRMSAPKSRGKRGGGNTWVCGICFSENQSNARRGKRKCCRCATRRPGTWTQTSWKRGSAALVRALELGFFSRLKGRQKYQCSLCDEEVPGIDLPAHARKKSHVAAMRSIDGRWVPANPGGTPLSCTVCEARFGRTSAVPHLRGKKHAKNLNKLTSLYVGKHMVIKPRFLDEQKRRQG